MSISVEDKVSDAMGSAGTGTGSRTGSGGPGTRFVEDVGGGGGGRGRATGGFFFEHALTSISATIATATTVRLCFIVSAFSLFSRLAGAHPARSHSATSPPLGPQALPRAKARGYCDQFGYLFMPVLVICCRFFPSRSIRKICALPALVDVNAM